MKGKKIDIFCVDCKREMAKLSERCIQLFFDKIATTLKSTGLLAFPEYVVE